MLSPRESQLWKKIEEFNIDNSGSQFTFTDRLCRENDWTMEYSLRAVLEYKRFMFLVCISDASQTPSDQVDQVWHLHLLYTRSYWVEFCKGTLNKEIHHGPTTGTSDRPKFTNLYINTLSFYKEKIGTTPPADIWPQVDERISNIHFTRVNRHKYWLIPKLFTK